MRANASRDRNRGYESIVTEILEEAERVDREEDERYGQARGDELPEPLRTREGRRAALAAARERIERERAAAVEAGEEVIERIELGLDRDRFPGSPDGREAWLRQGRRELEARREREALPIPQGRGERLVEARRRLDQQLAYEHAANREYEQYRATAVDRLGRRLSNYNRPNPYRPPLVPEGKINVTDPDSREMRTQGQPNIQGYNAQAVVTEQQIVIAAEITTQSPDFGQLEPMVSAAVRELEQTGVSERPRTVLADAGYWHTKQIEKLRGDGFEVLVPPDSTVREDARPGWEGGIYDAMRRVAPNTRRPPAVPQTKQEHRAGLRADQAQPRDDPLPTKRQGRRKVGMAPDLSHPQPPEAPQPLDRPRGRVNRQPRARGSAEPRSPSHLCPTSSDNSIDEMDEHAVTAPVGIPMVRPRTSLVLKALVRWCLSDRSMVCRRPRWLTRSRPAAAACLVWTIVGIAARASWLELRDANSVRGMGVRLRRGVQLVRCIR